MLQSLSPLLQNTTLLVILVAWVLPWKGVALWKAARLRDKWWFIVILVLNTLGVLEVFYVFFISRRKACFSKNKADA